MALYEHRGERNALYFAVKSSAESLNERILALPAPEATLKDKDEIQACQALYESLSAQEQAQIVQYDKVEALLGGWPSSSGSRPCGRRLRRFPRRRISRRQTKPR